MVYSIEHETSGSIRIKTGRRKIGHEEEEILRYALEALHGVTDVMIFRATGSIRLSYTCSREYLLEKLSSLRYENIEMLAEKSAEKIGTEEIRERKLSPELKRRLRKRLLFETAADVLLPEPVQVAYHLYQFVTLKNL